MNFKCVFGHLFYRGGPANMAGWGCFLRFMEVQVGKTMAETDDKNQPAMFDDTRGYKPNMHHFWPVRVLNKH